MTFCEFMDPINWAHRFYLIECIKECGFENGWEPIMEKFKQLCATLQPGHNSQFNSTPQFFHLWYLQILAEFGDFRKLSDPLTPPSQEIIDKIKRMRRSQLRHELLIANNQIRYNNYLLKHHNEKPLINLQLEWTRFDTAPVEAPQVVCSPLVQVCIDLKEKDYHDLLQKLNPQGKKIMKPDDILGRCINGVISDPLELLRDILMTYTYFTIGQLSEKERIAVNQFKQDALELLEPLLADDERWARIREFVV